MAPPATTFSYDLASTDPRIAAISKIRLEIGDNVENQGVLPTGKNFKDAEIYFFWIDEGENQFRAIAAICGTLARHWARMADITTGDVSRRNSAVAKEWRAESDRLRAVYGWSNGYSSSFSTGMSRTDGYSDDSL
jgi:hypothetical protein